MIITRRIKKAVRGSRSIQDPSQTDSILTSLIDPQDIRLQKVIEEGRFGKVHLGTCRGSMVAIKQIDMKKTSSSELKDEIRILAAERHVNIVMLMGICEYPSTEGPQLLILTEYCCRGNLKRVLEDASISIPLSLGIQFGIDIAQGMAWMASMNKPSGKVILHRDLKPANVLVCQDWTCKIADFGLANLNKRDKNYYDRNYSTGSLPYMAPEVFLNGALTPALDVYAYGIVLWEIFTRSTTWYEPLTEFFEKHVVENGKRPNIDLIKYPELALIITSCWDHEPTLRPTFETLVSTMGLQIARADIFLSEFPDGRDFWLSEFSSYCVGFQVFIKAFEKFLLMKISVKHVELLRRILCPKGELDFDQFVVKIECFANFLRWFGPIKAGDSSILHSVDNLSRQPWFFGLLSSLEATQRLSGTCRGTFLIRLNTGQRRSVSSAPYVLSRLDARTQQVRHSYIHYEGGQLLIKISTNGSDDNSGSFSDKNESRREREEIKGSERRKEEKEMRGGNANPTLELFGSGDNMNANANNINSNANNINTNANNANNNNPNDLNGNTNHTSNAHVNKDGPTNLKNSNSNSFCDSYGVVNNLLRHKSSRKFSGQTLNEILERIRRIDVWTLDRNCYPFISSICPGHPFADLFPTHGGSGKVIMQNPTDGYDRNDSSESSD
eukprot:TRINITY_DN5632_c0_g1_i5.p1 TRINITY_DN5632_c0_g1~~TRINITY_DN5632_c0_g1_i5.p1  ORF type:complete len:669 (-),score=117.23 TRINITY_DN5632_c0_g1_i5:140-2146(-)